MERERGKKTIDSQENETKSRIIKINQHSNSIANSASHLPQRVPFVGVEAALHAEDGDAAEETNHHPAGMPYHRRHREVGDSFVVELITILQLLRQPS